jgi:polyvinyl alcohol dehydrogenase (cytochrome)
MIRLVRTLSVPPPIVVPFLVMLLGIALAAPGCGSQPKPAGTTAGTPAASASATQQPPVTGGNWPTYHADLRRTGLEPSGAVWTTVKRQWESATLDGDIYAEPLVVGEQVIVATENDSLYSLDLSTGNVM